MVLGPPRLRRRPPRRGGGRDRRPHPLDPATAHPRRLGPRRRLASHPARPAAQRRGHHRATAHRRRRPRLRRQPSSSSPPAAAGPATAAQPGRLAPDQPAAGHGGALTPERVMTGERPRRPAGRGVRRRRLLRRARASPSCSRPRGTTSTSSRPSRWCRRSPTTPSKGPMLRQHLHDVGVTMHVGVTVLARDDDGIAGETQYGDPWTLAVDDLVLVTHQVPDRRPLPRARRRSRGARRGRHHGRAPHRGRGLAALDLGVGVRRAPAGAGDRPARPVVPRARAARPPV